MILEPRKPIERVVVGNASDTHAACMNAAKALVSSPSLTRHVTKDNDHCFVLVVDPGGTIAVEVYKQTSLSGLADMLGHSAATRILSATTFGAIVQSPSTSMRHDASQALLAHAHSDMVEASEGLRALHGLVQTREALLESASHAAMVAMVGRKADPVTEELSAIVEAASGVLRYLNQTAWPSQEARDALSRGPGGGDGKTS